MVSSRFVGSGGSFAIARVAAIPRAPWRRALALELTALVHGSAERDGAEAAGRALFGQGDLADLPAATLAAALAETPHGTVEAAEVVGGLLPTIDELLVRSGLVTSKSQARRTIAEGGAYLNNLRVAEETYAPTTADLLGGQWLVLRRGKRSVGGIRVLS